MKFTKMVAVVAILGLALNAHAGTDGAGAIDSATTGSSNKAINININQDQSAKAQSGQSQNQTQAQPNTTVNGLPETGEAAALRKARQSAEQETEERIQEKLEDSRLQEERDRASRIFGNRLDDKKEQQNNNQQQPTVVIMNPTPAPATAPAAPAPAVVPAAAPAPAVAPAAPAPVVAPAVAPAPAPAPQAEKPTQVNIEKVEIVEPQQPKDEKSVVAPVETKSEAKAAEDTEYRFYVSGSAGNMSYQASNVKSNYALGVAAGVLIDNRFAVELGYMFSNHNVADLWSDELYHTLNQSDISLSGKYYLLQGKLKPYLGASMSYVNRVYTDLYNPYGYGYGTGGYSSTESTTSVDMGVLGGVDYALSDKFWVGLGVDYNFNVETSNEIQYDSSFLPSGVKPLEQISYYTIKATIKFMF